MAQLNLICTTQRLSNWDKDAGWMCGLIVSAATDQGAPLYAEGLKPWLWPAITSIRYALLDKDGKVLKKDSAKVIGAPSQPQAAAAQPLLDNLDRVYAECYTDSAGVHHPENLEWNPVPFDDAAPVTYRKPLRPKQWRKPWASVLGKAATYPFPLAQAANLSFLFRAPMVNNAVTLIAAPEVAANPGAFPAKALSPDGDPVKGKPAEDERIYRWPYKGLDDWPAVAYVAPADTNPAAGSGLLDPVSQWIQVRDQETILPDEWLGQAEQRIADVFDLSQRIVDFMRSGQAQSFLKNPADLSALVDMAVAGLRDVAGAGWAPAPDGSRLPARLLELASRAQAFNDAEIDAIDAVKIQPGLDQWRLTLRERVKSAADLAVLNAGTTNAALAITELEKLHEAVLDTETEGSLAALAQQHWTDLLAKAALPGRVIADTVRLMSSHVKEVNLRRQLSLSNLGRLWSDLVQSNVNVKDDKGHELLEVCVPSYFVYYFAQRYDLTPPASLVADPAICKPPKAAPDYWPRVTLKPSDALRDALAQFIKNWANRFAATLIPKAAIDPAKAPHPVSFQLGRLAPEPVDKNGFNDTLDRFSGVGLLLREAGQAWQCLNLTNAISGNQLIELPGRAPLLAPYRVSFKSGLRQVCLSYNNQPILGDSPLSRLTSRYLEGNDAAVNLLLTYVFSPEVKFPGLKDGYTYECRAFAIANSGVLPREIGNENSPRELDADKLKKLGPGAGFKYLRRVPVGHLRVKQQDAKANDIPFPSIPAGVAPRARDVVTLTTTKNTYQEAIQAANEDRRDIPLLLTHDKLTEPFTMLLQHPATTWDCWSRWVAGWTTDTSAIRASVIADYFKKAEENLTTPQAAPLTADDPALKAPDGAEGVSKLYLELQVCDAQGDMKPAQNPHRFVSFSAPAAKDGMASQRAPEIRVACMWSPSSEGISQTGDVVVTTRQGSLYRLTAWVCLPSSNVLARFDAGVIDADAREVNDGPTAHRLVSPYYLNIEAVNLEMPKPESLWEAFRPEFIQKDSGSAVTVSLSKNNQGAADPLLANASAAALRRQVWRWQGRATQPHPLVADFSAADKIPEWEAVEFGDRPESDHVLMDMTLNPPQPDGTRSFVYLEDLERKDSRGSTLLEQRALHYRFSVTAYSRYQGLTQDRLAADAIARVPDSDSADAQLIDVRWKPLFAPCRRQTSIPAPKIRLILPLTEAASGSSANPGLLAVLSEPWHEIGGLAETLEAEIEVKPDPSVPENQATKFYYELGPDPIVTNELSPNLAKAYESRGYATVSGIAGPVGHFFDASNRSAYFPATSFIIPAPTLTEPQQPDFSWYFAKLRLRRTLNSATQTGVPAKMNGKAGIDYRTQQFFSPWTEPLWVQYLPPFSIFDGSRLTDGDLRVQMTSPNSFKLAERDGTARRLNRFPSKAGTPVFTLFAVLTRKVFDVTGHRDQEQYLGLFVQQENEWKLADPPSLAEPPSAAAQLRVRIIEVQSPAAVQANQLWSQLFGEGGAAAANSNDVNVRIVRISEPVENTGFASADCEGNRAN